MGNLDGSVNVATPTGERLFTQLSFALYGIAIDKTRGRVYFRTRPETKSWLQHGRCAAAHHPVRNVIGNGPPSGENAGGLAAGNPSPGSRVGSENLRNPTQYHKFSSAQMSRATRKQKTLQQNTGIWLRGGDKCYQFASALAVGILRSSQRA